MAKMGVTRRNRFRAGGFAITNQRSGVFQPLQFFPPRIALAGAAVAYLRFRFRVGNFLRLALAIRRSSALLIDLYIPLDAPRSDFLERLPRLAASAAPAAICCFLDFAGITKIFRTRDLKRI